MTAPLEFQPFQDYVRVISVNLLGHVLVTKSVLPLLRKSPAARIVNISSLAGLIGSASMSCYNASKFGIEGFSDSLRRELAHLNISISLIEPGFAKTAIIGSGTDYLTQKIIPSVPKDVFAAYAPILPSDSSQLSKKIYENAFDPELVVDAILDAFTSPKPKTRYCVNWLYQIIAFLNWILPTSAMDMIIALHQKHLMQQ